MKSLVVPLDGSGPVTNTLTLVGLLACTLDARIELIHAVNRSPIQAIRPDSSEDPREMLDQARASLPCELDVETLIVSGDPVERVLDRVRQLPDALLVVLSRGRAGLSRAVFGSVSDELVRTSPVPVIITREGMRFPAQTLNSILVPLDSSPLSERALPWGETLALPSDARVSLVSVIDVNQVAAYAGIDRQPDLIAGLESEARDLAREYLEEQVKKLRGNGVRASWEVRLGRPSDEIVRAAETIAVDLVVMSTHGRGGIRRWAFGSVTDDVLQHGSAPVMIVPN